MRKHLSSLAAVLPVLVLMVSTLAPGAAQSISADEGQAMAQEAYLYFYPLVTMDVTRKQLINSDPKTAGIGGPSNTFDNIQAYPTADMKAVVRPNCCCTPKFSWMEYGQRYFGSKATTWFNGRNVAWLFLELKTKSG